MIKFKSPGMSGVRGYQKGLSSNSTSTSLTNHKGTSMTTSRKGERTRKNTWLFTRYLSTINLIRGIFDQCSRGDEIENDPDR